MRIFASAAANRSHYSATAIATRHFRFAFQTRAHDAESDSSALYYVRSSYHLNTMTPTLVRRTMHCMCQSSEARGVTAVASAPSVGVACSTPMLGATRVDSGAISIDSAAVLSRALSTTEPTERGRHK